MDYGSSAVSSKTGKRRSRWGWTLALAAVTLLTLGAPARAADYLLATPYAVPGSHPDNNGPVWLFRSPGAAPLVPLPSIPQSQVHDPVMVAFTSRGELLVANRHGNVGSLQGSISRFLIDPVTGVPIPNGAITGNGLEAVHGLAFSPTGELFAANRFGTISRFFFDADWNPIPNGTFSTGQELNLGLAFSPGGELFVTHSSAVISRFQFNPGTGAVEPHGTFGVEFGRVLNELEFGPQGDLFVAGEESHRIFRFRFDPDGAPVESGTFVTPYTPIDVAFSPDGELFVSSVQPWGIARYTFDALGNPTPNGFTPVEYIGGLAIRGYPAVDTAAPRCTPGSVVVQSPSRVFLPVTAADGVSGVARIALGPRSTNCILEWDSPTGVQQGTEFLFNPPVFSVAVRAVKLDPTRSARIELVAADGAGNAAVCDPVVATLTIPRSGASIIRRYGRLPETDRYVTIQNDAGSGLRGVTVFVNGKRAARQELVAGQVWTLDVARSLRPGRRNEILVAASGPRGGEAVLTIGDAPPASPPGKIRRPESVNLNWGR